MTLLYRTALIALLIAAAPAATAATLVVDTLDDELNADGDCSLREAVAAANTNAAVDGCDAGDAGADLITFLTAGALTLTQSAIEVTEDVRIVGPAVGALLTLSGDDSFRIFTVSAGTLALEGMVLVDGRAPSGAAVFVQLGAGLTATGVSFQNHVATGDSPNQGGAAIYSLGGMVELLGAQLSGNAASGVSGSGGAILNNNGQLTVSGSTFEGNSASRAGGAIEVRGGMAATEIDETDFASNTAGSNPGNGGALHITGASSADITGGTVTDNTAAREGGGFWNDAGTMTVDGVDFSGNEAQGDAADDGGGALFNNGGTMMVTGGSATGNSATGASGSGGGLMSVGGTLEVTGMTISGNAANRAGAGVESAGATTVLDGVTVDDNDIPTATASPGNGGGVHAGGGDLTIAGGTYTNNDATEGGALWASGLLTVQANDDGGTRLEANTGYGDDADNGGGGVFVEAGGEATISDAVITDNAATGAAGSGGGVFVTSDATALVTETEISGNEANRAGGGIEVAGGTLTLRGVIVNENVIPEATAAPGNGGGLHAGGGMVTIEGGEFVGNEATEGGGVWSNGAVEVSALGDDDDAVATEIRDNVGRGDDATNGGGGVYAETGGAISLADVLIEGNAATGTAGSGGGILVADGAQVVVLRGAIRDNAANRAGGGVEVADDGETDNVTSFLMNSVTLADNRIDAAAPGNGGGLHIGGAGAVRIDRSTVSGNTAVEGAGLWASGASSMEVLNSTVSGNAAAADGGGVYDDGGGAVSLESVTVALNDAGGSGGGMLSQSTDAFAFANTVVALNTATAGADCFGTFVSGDYNLVQDDTDCTITGDVANNVTGEDPMLGPLADNGGPTPTHEPQEGSPLVDAGQTDLGVDQRGFGRTVGQDDIGAVERGASPVSDEGAPTGGVLSLQPARPNPARGATTLAFTVAQAADARVELYNVLGQRVLVAFDGAASPDGESVRLDVSGLAPGVYVVRLQSGAEQATQRITVVR